MESAANDLAPLFSELAKGTTTTVKIFLLLTVMSFGSAIIIGLTAFTRIIIVLSLLRQAIGSPQLPPNQVVMGLALFMTVFIMTPTIKEMNEKVLGPFMNDEIDHFVAGDRAATVIKKFTLKQTRQEDLRTFYEIAGKDRPNKNDEIPLSIAAPAFMVSELTTAFQMGMYLFIPMVLIDLLVAGVLMSLGMMMVPPMMVTLPLKVGVFLLADGWHLIVTSIARSF
ncbi:MAG: flagellar biosynthetic protein FliP [Myxococcales bacterium]|nr:flagellar biosynthetic protein FliP [Myxococcales bacterium]